MTNAEGQAPSDAICSAESEDSEGPILPLSTLFSRNLGVH